MSEETVNACREVTERFRRKMVWTADERLYDTTDKWLDMYHGFMDEARAFIRCDCEDLALSLEHAWYELKIPAPDIAIHTVKMQHNRDVQFDHAVATVTIDGKTYVGDNASRIPFYPWDQMMHLPFGHAKYHDPLIWFKTT